MKISNRLQWIFQEREREKGEAGERKIEIRIPETWELIIERVRDEALPRAPLNHAVCMSAG